MSLRTGKACCQSLRVLEVAAASGWEPAWLPRRAAVISCDQPGRLAMERCGAGLPTDVEHHALHGKSAMHQGFGTRP